MNQTAHTPTPYKEDGSDICQNNNGHFHVIAQVKRWTDFSEDDFRNKRDTTHDKRWLVDMACPIEGTEEANAAFICKAVNTHKSLLEAVRQAEEALRRCYEVTEWPANGDSTQDRALEIVRQAIAKATGEQ